MKFYQTMTLIILGILNSCTNGQTKNHPLQCQDFKSGVFEMFIDNNRIVVERNDDFQFEKTAMGNSKYKIVWISDCEYELELLETNMGIAKNDIGQKYQVRIVDTQPDEYSYECRVKGIDFIDKGTLKRIK